VIIDRSVKYLPPHPGNLMYRSVADEDSPGQLLDLYLTSLALGGVGLAAMAVSGLAHHGHDGSTSHAAGGHSHGHGHAAGHAGGPDAGHVHHHSSDSHIGHGKDHGSHTLLALLSPRTLFSLCLGFGTAGVVLRSFLGGPVLLAGAVAGALLFEWLLVGPIWKFVLRFESSPAETLESAVTSEATATSTFDRNGNGMVSLEVDGQVVQLLGTLSPTDRALGVSVRAGARLRIEDVDVARNRCTVSLSRG
jgi:hypothetical protein